MKRTIVASSLAILLAAPFGVSAQDKKPEEKKPEPNFTISGNAGLFSDYRFRGFTQTGYKPAFQGGFDVAHKSGFYVGNWNSNVESDLYTGASLEMDFYAGYKMSAGPVGLDFGYLYYYYPNSGALGATQISNGEAYAGASYGPVSAKLFYATTHFFSLGKAPTNATTEFDTKGSWYLDVSGNFDVGGGWTINAHGGYQKVENGKTAFAQGIVFANTDEIYDLKLGVTKDLDGWLLGAAVVDTSKKGFFRTAQSGLTRDAGKTGVVLSVSKTF